MTPDDDRFDVDLFVIGGGSGGVRAARVAASHGARVMLAEEDRLGGTCVIRGCVPKKLMVYAGRFPDAFDEAAAFGWTVVGTRFDWPTLIDAKNREVARLEHLYVEGQSRAGVTMVKSRTVVEGPHAVRLLADQRVVRARVILIATGSRPEIFAPAGVRRCIVSDQIFDLPTLPRRMVIAGAGYIAVEFASLFAALGSDVTVVCRGDNLLRGFDEDLRDAVAANFRDRGIELLFGDAVTSVDAARRSDSSYRVRTQNNAVLLADQVLLAYGRVPNTKDLGLEQVGVRLNERGAVVVGPTSSSSVPSIFAMAT